MTDPYRDTGHTRRSYPMTPQRTTSVTPWIIAAAVALALLGGIWAFSDRIDMAANDSTPPPPNAQSSSTQTTGIGTSGSVDRPVKNDLQK